MTRKEKALITKENLYNSTLDLINEKGYEKVLIKDITDRAGLAKGSFYVHFESKEDLLYYTYKRTSTIYLDVLSKVKDKTDFYDMMKTFVYLSYEEIEKLGKEVIRAMCINYASKKSNIIFRDKSRGLYTALNFMVAFGQEQGVFCSNYSTDYYVEQIIISLVGIDNYWTLIDDKEGLAKLAEDTIDITIKGLACLK